MRKKIICGIILCSGTLCLADTWTWDDGGLDHAWTTCGNWQADACTKLIGYPSTTNDDVGFSVGGTVVIITTTIDDMVMARNITFDGNLDAVLTVDSLVLDTSGGDVILVVQGGATLVADGTN